MDLGEKGLSCYGRQEVFQVCCVLVTCKAAVKGGQGLAFVGSDRVALCPHISSDAVVDPFVEEVGPNESFWAMIKPARIDSIRHKFNAPVIPAMRNEEELHSQMSDGDVESWISRQLDEAGILDRFSFGVEEKLVYDHGV